MIKESIYLSFLFTIVNCEFYICPTASNERDIETLLDLAMCSNLNCVVPCVKMNNLNFTKPEGYCESGSDVCFISSINNDIVVQSLLDAPNQDVWFNITVASVSSNVYGTNMFTYNSNLEGMIGVNNYTLVPFAPMGLCEISYKHEGNELMFTNKDLNRIGYSYRVHGMKSSRWIRNSLTVGDFIHINLKFDKNPNQIIEARCGSTLFEQTFNWNLNSRCKNKYENNFANFVCKNFTLMKLIFITIFCMMVYGYAKYEFKWYRFLLIEAVTIGSAMGIYFQLKLDTEADILIPIIIFLIVTFSIFIVTLCDAIFSLITWPITYSYLAVRRSGKVPKFLICVNCKSVQGFLHSCDLNCRCGFKASNSKELVEHECKYLDKHMNLHVWTVINSAVNLKVANKLGSFLLALVLWMCLLPATLAKTEMDWKLHNNIKSSIKTGQISLKYDIYGTDNIRSISFPADLSTGFLSTLLFAYNGKGDFLGVINSDQYGRASFGKLVPTKCYRYTNYNAMNLTDVDYFHICQLQAVSALGWYDLIYQGGGAVEYPKTNFYGSSNWKVGHQVRKSYLNLLFQPWCPKTWKYTTECDNFRLNSAMLEEYHDGGFPFSYEHKLSYFDGCKYPVNMSKPLYCRCTSPSGHYLNDNKINWKLNTWLTSNLNNPGVNCPPPFNLYNSQRICQNIEVDYFGFTVESNITLHHSFSKSNNLNIDINSLLNGSMDAMLKTEQVTTTLSTTKGIGNIIGNIGTVIDLLSDGTTVSSSGSTGTTHLSTVHHTELTTHESDISTTVHSTANNEVSTTRLMSTPTQQTTTPSVPEGCSNHKTIWFSHGKNQNSGNVMDINCNIIYANITVGCNSDKTIVPISSIIQNKNGSIFLASGSMLICGTLKESLNCSMILQSMNQGLHLDDKEKLEFCKRYLTNTSIERGDGYNYFDDCGLKDDNQLNQVTTNPIYTLYYYGRGTDLRCYADGPYKSKTSDVLSLAYNSLDEYKKIIEETSQNDITISFNEIDGRTVVHGCIVYNGSGYISSDKFVSPKGFETLSINQLLFYISSKCSTKNGWFIADEIIVSRVIAVYYLLKKCPCKFSYSSNVDAFLIPDRPISIDSYGKQSLKYPVRIMSYDMYSNTVKEKYVTWSDLIRSIDFDRDGDPVYGDIIKRNFDDTIGNIITDPEWAHEIAEKSSKLNMHTKRNLVRVKNYRTSSSQHMEMKVVRNNIISLIFISILPLFTKQANTLFFLFIILILVNSINAFQFNFRYQKVLTTTQKSVIADSSFQLEMPAKQVLKKMINSTELDRLNIINPEFTSLKHKLKQRWIEYEDTISYYEDPITTELPIDNEIELDNITSQIFGDADAPTVYNIPIKNVKKKFYYQSAKSTETLQQFTIPIDIFANEGISAVLESTNRNSTIVTLEIDVINSTFQYSLTFLYTTCDIQKVDVHSDYSCRGAGDCSRCKSLVNPPDDNYYMCQEQSVPITDCFLRSASTCGYCEVVPNLAKCADVYKISAIGTAFTFCVILNEHIMCDDQDFKQLSKLGTLEYYKLSDEQSDLNIGDIVAVKDGHVLRGSINDLQEEGVKFGTPQFIAGNILPEVSPTFNAYVSGTSLVVNECRRNTFMMLDQLIDTGMTLSQYNDILNHAEWPHAMPFLQNRFNTKQLKIIDEEEVIIAVDNNKKVGTMEISLSLNLPELRPTGLDPNLDIMDVSMSGCYACVQGLIVSVTLKSNVDTIYKMVCTQVTRSKSLSVSSGIGTYDITFDITNSTSNISCDFTILGTNYLKHLDFGIVGNLTNGNTVHDSYNPLIEQHIQDKNGFWNTIDSFFEDIGDAIAKVFGFGEGFAQFIKYLFYSIVILLILWIVYTIYRRCLKCKRESREYKLELAERKQNSKYDLANNGLRRRLIVNQSDMKHYDERSDEKSYLDTFKEFYGNARKQNKID